MKRFMLVGAVTLVLTLVATPTWAEAPKSATDFKIDLPKVGVPLKDGKVMNAIELNPTGNGGKASGDQSETRPRAKAKSSSKKAAPSKPGASSKPAGKAPAK